MLVDNWVFIDVASSRSRSDLRVDFNADLITGGFKVKGGLPTEPEFGRCAKVTCEAEGGIGCDRAFAVDDCLTPPSPTQSFPTNHELRGHS